MEISKRLMAVAGEIAFDTIADIGCDHGYIPIYACQIGQVKRAIACDVGTGPLERAAENIEKYGLSHRIETRLGSGLASLREGEARTVVMAGLGGRLIIDMLQEAGNFLRQVEQLILQPQRDVPSVRRCIHELGFMIENEIMVYEDRIYYTILNCRPESGGMNEIYTPKEYLIGKILIDRRDEVLAEYIVHRREKLLKVRKGIVPMNEKNRKRLMEVDDELEMLG